MEPLGWIGAAGMDWWRRIRSAIHSTWQRIVIRPRACAGTVTWTGPNSATRVYPRACGEPPVCRLDLGVSGVYPRACGVVQLKHVIVGR